MIPLGEFFWGTLKKQVIQYKSETQMMQCITYGCTEIDRNTALINCVSCNFAQCIELYNFNKDNTVSILCNVMEHIMFFHNNYLVILYNNLWFQTFKFENQRVIIPWAQRNSCIMIFRQWERSRIDIFEIAGTPKIVLYKWSSVLLPSKMGLIWGPLFTLWYSSGLTTLLNHAEFSNLSWRKWP